MAEDGTIGLRDVEAAAARLRGQVRRTPLMAAAPGLPGMPAGLTLKLECLQLSGSFKIRGATNKLMALRAAGELRGLVTASGGNHGAAVAAAAQVAGVPATIVVPTGAGALKRRKIAASGAELIVAGAVWDESNREALAIADARGLAYVHPFADPAVIAGQGTTALEILHDAPDTDTLLIAVGGGGLISGVSVAANALRPGVRVVGVEPTGCPTLKAALAAGRPVRLERVDTVVPTMAAAETVPLVVELCRERVADVVLVSDAAMAEAARALWWAHGLAVDLSAAAAVAALMTGAYVPEPGERVCALVCGAGTDGID